MLTRGVKKWGAAVAVGVAATLCVPAAAAAPVEPGEGVPSGVVVVDGQEVPVHGSFLVRRGGYPDSELVGGYVHGVRRVDGGTVVYYSMGVPAGSDDPFIALTAFDYPTGVYQGNEALAELKLVDLAGGKAYSPLWDDEGGLASTRENLKAEAGELVVGWAAFPELPESTTSVQVLMPGGAGVRDIPVEDGPLLPVADGPAPLLGEGWPEVPEGDALAGTDAAAASWTLATRTGDIERVVQEEVTAEEIAVTLDANVLFASGSAELTAESQAALAGVASDIAARATGEVVVTGHTDSDGSDSFNQTLSEQRAASVRAVLEPASGGAVTFTSVGKGEADPIAENTTDEGKQANRRVTVVYQVKGGGQ